MGKNSMILIIAMVIFLNSMSPAYPKTIALVGGTVIDFSNFNSAVDKTEKQLMRPAGFGDPKVHEINKNVVAVIGLYHSAGKGFGVNAGIIFTSRSVVFIDAGMTIASAKFLWKVAQERMKGNDSLYLILTHHHSDNKKNW